MPRFPVKTSPASDRHIGPADRHKQPRRQRFEDGAICGFSFQQLKAPALMGVVNITPDSFSDGGRYLSAEHAAAHARRLAAEGAAIVDLGAEASSFFRAGVQAVSSSEQLARLMPVLHALQSFSGAVISVDTRDAAVARAALASGAGSINDISAGTHDPELLSVVAQTHAGLILMYIAPAYPATPAHDQPNIVATVHDYLRQRVAAALAAGIPPDRLAVDPGIGFGHTMADNWRLVARCGDLASLGVPVVLGASRKRFLETLPPDGLIPAWADTLGRTTRKAQGLADLHGRDPASAAVVRLTAQTAAIHRVHHVTLAGTALTM